jgi:hypothetical protein
MQNSMKEITKNLTELCKKIDEALSQDHILFDIEFGRSKFKFYYPSTRKDARKLRLERKRLIKMLLSDALKELVKEILDCDFESDFIVDERAWQRVSQLQNMCVKKEDVASKITAAEYETIRLGKGDKARPLNFETYQVEMQRPKPDVDAIMRFICNPEDYEFEVESEDKNE